MAQPSLDQRRRERISTTRFFTRVFASVMIISGLCVNGESAFAQFAATNFLSGDAAGAVASTADNTAVGTNAMALGSRSTAVGTGATASVNNATALGKDASASGVSSTALGKDSIASDTSATAVGSAATASGFGSTALGVVAVASGDNAVAIGGGASAAFSDSTAIGVGATTTRSKQMVFGNTTTTYTATGIASAASKAAQSGPVELVTSDASGNLATLDPATLGIASTGQAERNSEGVAMAMALSGIPNILPTDATYALSTNWGSFGGENAVAIGGAAAVTSNIFIHGGGAWGSNGRHNSGGGRAGATFTW